MIAARQKGVTMVEVLITIFVLAIGLTGIMSMESYAIRMNHQSYLRTQAILQAQEMADRIHANLEGASAGFYGTAIPTSITQNCLSAPCTPAQLAEFDKWEWRTNTLAILPGAVVSLALNNSTGIHTITIQWKEESNDTVTDKSFVFEYKPLPLNLL